MTEKKSMYQILRDIKKESKDAESYNTGLLGEQMIVASYKTMTVDKLDKIRFIINKIIKKKIEQKRIADNIAKKNKC